MKPLGNYIKRTHSYCCSECRTYHECVVAGCQGSNCRGTCPKCHVEAMVKERMLTTKLSEKEYRS